jgi:hypothetical protein
LAVSVIRAEFLFEKSVAADDKFLCLHKKLYRREKPAASGNPARILSQMRMLQAVPSSYPIGMNPDLIPDYNALYAYLAQTITFTTNPRSYKNICDDLYNKGYIEFFKSDEFKVLVKESADTTFANFKASGMIGSNPPTSIVFSGAVGAATKTKIDQMMKDYLQQYNIDQAISDGISYNKVVYVMLNILPLFKEDVQTARTAYEDAYSSNRDQVKGSETINSAAIIRWIESIKTRYAQLKAAPTPDTQEILEPYENSGFIPTETPSGNYLEPVDAPTVPKPTEIEEQEPSTPTFPTVNDSLLVPDLIIEIQRTYNVQKMLLTYNQLPQALRNDIDSCKLNLAGALSRCETAFGTGNCEAISGAAVHQKCPAGTLRQGCCKCVTECDANLYYTSARGFCLHKSDLHSVPSIVSAGSATSGQTVNAGLNLAIGSCKDGFALNKFLCYKTCPTGTRSVGGSACLKDQPIILGSPFMWTAGDE